MTNKPKRIGTEGENAVVRYLIERGYKYAKRITLTTPDIGDVYPGDGIPVTVQVKAGKSATPGIPSNLSAALAQARNAGNPYGVLWSKRMGKGSAGEWIVSMSGEQFVDLLSQVYPPPS